MYNLLPTGTHRFLKLPRDLNWGEVMVGNLLEQV